jgi:hypothetical protein
MRGLRNWFLLSLVLTATCSAQAATGRVIKVLPQFLDSKGRAALSPSLYDRDAYQAQLRQHPAQRSALRFEVQWKAKKQKSEVRSQKPEAGSQKPETALSGLKLRVELHGVAEGNAPRQAVLETEVKPGLFSRWTALTLSGEAYKKFGEVTAWRTTLWDGDQLLGEQKSFLW